jgi:PAS domain S-box-containing protein
LTSTPTASNRELRRRAEDKFKAYETTIEDSLSPEETKKLLHDLQVHQIELEMQNDELLRTKHELRDSHTRYFDLYDLAPVGYLTLNEQGLIQEANLAAATMLGMKRASLVNQPISRVIHKEDQDIYYLHRRELLKSGKPQACDLRLVKSGGAPCWVHLAASAVSDPSTNPGQDADATPVLRIVLSDVTEHKRAEQQISRDLDALTRMQALSTRLFDSGGLGSTLQEIMATAVAIVSADKGTLQLLEGDTLRIVAHYGQEDFFLDYFASAEKQASTCGEATKQGGRVVVEDIETSSLFAGTPALDILRRAGVRSVQSTPLLNRKGRLLGILSTHWGSPHVPSEQELWRIDLLARQTADLIEHKFAEEALIALNRSLESRVADRTEKLAASVESLRTEIAERESAEENILRLNRLYLVLSQSNHAIVSTKDRNKLLDEFCRIAVEDGGFKLAWVGLADDDGGVQVAASCGAIGYLEDIRISPGKASLEFWPTGLSLQADTYCICNDFLDSPLTSPCQEAGAAHGIASAASIPLKLEGKVVGALTLYADEKGFFDQQQTVLLNQMGADFSFALDSIHGELKRKEAERALFEQTEIRLQTVEALRAKEQMLIQQSRQAALGEMIGNIAHQWRQPLNTLGLAIQEMKMMHDLGECDEEFINQNVAKSMELIQHMSQTIDDFRDFLKPDKNKTEFSISEVIASTLLLVHASFKHQRVEIELVTKHSPAILGYRNEFAQSLLNILNNATDALTERKVEHPKVTITIFREGDRSVVTVSDNAGGIPAGIIDKIFDPYFSTKGPQTGTGLGLFMAKAIIEKNLGGRLTARNAGDGAEIRIEV